MNGGMNTIGYNSKKNVPDLLFKISYMSVFPTSRYPPGHLEGDLPSKGE
jgi:hypothetical protein